MTMSTILPLWHKTKAEIPSRELFAPQKMSAVNWQSDLLPRPCTCRKDFRPSWTEYSAGEVSNKLHGAQHSDNCNGSVKGKIWITLIWNVDSSESRVLMSQTTLEVSPLWVCVLVLKPLSHPYPSWGWVRNGLTCSKMGRFHCKCCVKQTGGSEELWGV